MRLSIRHKTSSRYDSPAEYTAQILRLTPRAHEGMRVLEWNVMPCGRGRLARFEDGFANISHMHTVADAHDALGIEVRGVVETIETQGAVRGGVELLPIGAYLRTTPLTLPTEAVAGLAAAAASEAATATALRRLLELVAETVRYEHRAMRAGTTADQALHEGAGTCHDQAHVFVAAARALGIPARYVGGYLCSDGQTRTERVESLRDEAGHAWVEAWDSETGWTAFDPATGTLPGPWHVRTSIGLDYETASPMRAFRRGKGAQALEIDLRVARLAEQ